MNELAGQVLQVAKEYLGPAAQQFLSKELRALECTADTVTPWHLSALSERARIAAARIMDGARASEFGDRVAGLGAAALAPASSAAGAAQPTAHAKSRDGGAPRLALDAAAKLLASGKLRQAEEAYRQLVQKHGDTESFRGLARTAVALEDISAAILALRDGAASLTRKGDRAEAIVLLTEAVAIAPGDLAAHRRLAAAHANAGDTLAACTEYERFVDYTLAEGDSRRAWLELTYARETLGDLPGLVRLVDRLVPGGAPTPAPRPVVAAPAPKPAAPAQRVATQQVSPPPPQPSAVRRLVPAEPPAAQRIVRTMTSVDAMDEAPVDLAARIAPRSKDAVRKVSQAAWKARPAIDIEAMLGALQPGSTPDQQAAATAMRASILIGARDARATEVAIDAARRLLSLHKLQAASDLLLDFIGAGYTDREAQRLLIEVDCGLGRRDVARDKCRLLGEAYRLDGRADTANDVERLAAII